MIYNFIQAHRILVPSHSMGVLGTREPFEPIPFGTSALSDAPPPSAPRPSDSSFWSPVRGRLTCSCATLRCSLLLLRSH